MEGDYGNANFTFSRGIYWSVLKIVKNDLGPRTQILGKSYFLQANIIHK